MREKQTIYYKCVYMCCVCVCASVYLVIYIRCNPKTRPSAFIQRDERRCHTRHRSLVYLLFAFDFVVFICLFLFHVEKKRPLESVCTVLIFCSSRMKFTLVALNRLASISNSATTNVLATSCKPLPTIAMHVDDDHHHDEHISLPDPFVPRTSATLAKSLIGGRLAVTNAFTSNCFCNKQLSLLLKSLIKFAYIRYDRSNRVG